MTKPMNFPERKRLRQLGALGRLANATQAGISNLPIIQKLLERTASSKLEVRTKKDRSAHGRFRNA